MDKGGLGLITPPQQLGWRPFIALAATFCGLGIVANNEVPELLDKWALRYDDGVEEKMINP